MVPSKRTPKLQLNKETLRTLTGVRTLAPGALRNVEGGGPNDSDACIAPTYPGDCYNPDPTIPSACLHTCSYSR